MEWRNYRVNPWTSIASRSVAVVLGAILIVACQRPVQQKTLSTIPDFLVSPPLLSPVPLGSLDVRAFPGPGLISSLAVAVELETEPGVKILYALHPVESGAADLTPYDHPLLLWAPVTVWAQGIDADGMLGPLRSFTYATDPHFREEVPSLSLTRLPNVKTMPPVSIPPAALAAFPVASEERSVVVDGHADDWTAATRTKSHDGLGDVPREAADLVWAAGEVADDAIFFAFAAETREVRHDPVTYGIDIGPSQISLETFGPGADYVYRLEWQNGTFRATKSDGSAVSLIPGALQGTLGEIAEWRLGLDSLPALDGQSNLAVRAYVVATAHGIAVTDRAEPFFLRSPFDLVETQVDGGGTRQWRLDCAYNPDLAPAIMGRSFLDPAATVLKELEPANGIPIYAEGSLPLFYVPFEESGYAGLNTTDRGLMTTVGPGAGAMARAQILAHELAHYQNARYSRLSARWLQEGMSEWAAERILYAHFPARAVHRFLRKLRFDRYFDTATVDGDDFPLGEWGTKPSDLGYQKSLMALDLIEARVGQSALINAFRRAVNDPMDSDAFERFVGAVASRDLEPLFAFWVRGARPAEDVGPALFLDGDADGLFAIDEEVLGTDPELQDSDGDGFGDGEEYFAGRDPVTSNLTEDTASSPILVARESAELSELMRLGGVPGQTLTYSLNPFESAPALIYRGPILLRPPYALAVAPGEDGTVGPKVILERELFVDGAPVAIDIPDRQILPPTPLTSRTEAEDIRFGSPAGSEGVDELAAVDLVADLPSSLSAYDVVGAQARLSNAALAMELHTAGDADPSGQFGDYVFTIENVQWSSNGPLVQRLGMLLVSSAGIFWYAPNDQGVESAQLAHKGVTVSISGRAVAATVEGALLAPISAAAEELHVRMGTRVNLDEGTELRDVGVMVTLQSPALTGRAAVVADTYGLSNHQLELFVPAGQFTEVRANAWLGLGVTALRQFERALGRPLLDRTQWPLHVFLDPSGTVTRGSADARAGAWIRVDEALEGPSLDYLIVEQLARLVVADLLDRGLSAPYWVVEAFVQWITSAALYGIYPTTSIHSFHRGRIDDWRCFAQGGCQSLFPDGDMPLEEWSLSTLGSTGSVKSLMFTLALDAKLGSATVGKVLTTFINTLPAAETFKELCAGVAPEQRDEIDALWTLWVTGGNDAAADRAAILSSVQDGDGDGLWRFEEDSFGTSDAVATPYFP